MERKGTPRTPTPDLGVSGRVGHTSRPAHGAPVEEAPPRDAVLDGVDVTDRTVVVHDGVEDVGEDVLGW